MVTMMNWSLAVQYRFVVQILVCPSTLVGCCRVGGIIALIDDDVELENDEFEIASLFRSSCGFSTLASTIECPAALFVDCCPVRGVIAINDSDCCSNSSFTIVLAV